jgi:hypothetical protein
MAKTFGTTKMRAGDIGGLRHLCAWDGCTASYDIKSGQPEDWRMLLLFHAPGPIISILDIGDGAWTRDTVLCPKHWRELDGLLKDIGNKLRDVAGSA